MMKDPKTDAGFRQHVLEQRYSILGQSVFDLTSNAPIHDEWLVRFDGRESLQGLLRPAELSGAISELDLAMLARAVKTLNVDKRRLPIAVNISGASIMEPDFEAKLFAVLSGYKSSPDRLLFELTETWDLRDLDPAIDILTKLSNKGHALCLDDVGAGAASLRYLRAFKTDWLKIDGDFVQAAVNCPRERAILRALLTLKTDLGVRFIAEGVETDDILKFVKSEGFDAAQGYALSRPKLEPLRRM